MQDSKRVLEFNCKRRIKQLKFFDWLFSPSPFIKIMVKGAIYHLDGKNEKKLSKNFFAENDVLATAESIPNREKVKFCVFAV